MGKTLFIDSVEVCDINKDPLPTDANGFFIATFSPVPLGSSSILNLKVICNIIPDGQTQVAFRLLNFNQADYTFAMGNNNEIKYIREATSGIEVFLPFEVHNLKPFQGPNRALALLLRLIGRDSEPNSPASPPFTVTITGKN